MEEPKPGTPAWRDSKDKSFFDLMADPTKWEFRPSDEDEKRVCDAYVAATQQLPVPDADFVKVLIAHQFDTPGELNEQTRQGEGRKVSIKEVADFFTKRFCDDMYPEFKTTGQMFEVVHLWTIHKIKFILRANAMPYKDYEVEELHLHLLSPVSLAVVADKMNQLSDAGYSLGDHAVDGDQVVYFFRKERIVGGTENVHSIEEARHK